MIIKVCGMKHPENMRELNNLAVDWMGMIFYDKSPRFAGNFIAEDIAVGKKRIGVFVNAEMDYITGMKNRYDLDFIQLHGDETPEFSGMLNETIPVIKVFSIAQAADFKQTRNYEGKAAYFLFDTKTPRYGGSGKKFDWSILDEYTGRTPFILSGGISKDDVEEIRAIRHPLLAGIDLNSKFETEAGLKDIALLQQFIKELKDEQD